MLFLIMFLRLFMSQGMVLLILSVSVIPWHYRKALFFFALYILAVGEGGHKPCVQTFAADQFDQNLPEEKKAKSSFFNWWCFGIMVGATSAIIVVVYMEVNKKKKKNILISFFNFPNLEFVHTQVQSESCLYVLVN